MYVSPSDGMAAVHITGCLADASARQRSLPDSKHAISVRARRYTRPCPPRSLSRSSPIMISPPLPRPIRLCGN